MTTPALVDALEGLSLRVDSFFIPELARGEFEAAMRRNLAFIEKLPGYRGHLVLDKTSGPTEFNVVTIAVWESQDAYDRAAAEVAAYYARIGFDGAGTLARWGARAEIGAFVARRAA